MYVFFALPARRLFSHNIDCISIGTRQMSGAGSWRTVVGIGFIWPFILMCGIVFMPESPR